MAGDGRTVLVLGASGFIGGHVAAAAARAGWKVLAGARHPERARRLAPQLEWVNGDFRLRPYGSDWDPLLRDVDAVVNCVGVLQDGAFDSSLIAHVEGLNRLIVGCERAGVRRFIHLSAVGVGRRAGTGYARDKRRGELKIRRSDLDWLILRPSLVIAREVYGGTALMRGLAAFPGVMPAIGLNQAFRPVAIDDLAKLIVDLLDPAQEPRRVIEVAGPERVSLANLLQAYRRWLGIPPAPVVGIPRWLAAPILKLGDLAGWLGWRTALRTTSLRQVEFDVAGRRPATPGVRPFSDVLAAEPATIQDRWHARLYFLRPISILMLAAFWIATGLVTLRPPSPDIARFLLHSAGFGHWAGGVVIGGAAVDIALGTAVLVRPLSRWAALSMAIVACAYLAGATLWLPLLWLNPLGPWLKILPVIPLCLFVAATDDAR